MIETNSQSKPIPKFSSSSNTGPVSFVVGGYVSKVSVSDLASQNERKRHFVLQVAKHYNLTRRELERDSNLQVHQHEFVVLGTSAFREMNCWLRGKPVKKGPLIGNVLYAWARTKDRRVSETFGHDTSNGWRPLLPVSTTPARVLPPPPPVDTTNTRLSATSALSSMKKRRVPLTSLPPQPDSHTSFDVENSLASYSCYPSHPTPVSEVMAEPLPVNENSSSARWGLDDLMRDEKLVVFDTQ